MYREREIIEEEMNSEFRAPGRSRVLDPAARAPTNKK